jgi:diguanylate cyclase (GGDEF)-like protein
MIVVRNWLEHSHSILTNLQTTSQRLDRIDYSMQMYKVTKDEEDLRSAKSAAMAMHVGEGSLRNLLRDNPSQTHHADELETALHQLDRTIGSASESKTNAEEEIRECRRIVSVLQSEERDLLRQRSEESQTSGFRSLMSGAGYIGSSLIVVLVLFGFLLRDAMRRSHSEQQLTLTNDRLEATIEELERRGREAAVLKDARDELQLCVTSKEAQECTVRHLEALIPGSSGATFIINNSRSMLEMAATWNKPSFLGDGFELDACCGLRVGRARWRKPEHSEIDCNHFSAPPPDNYICIPLAAHGDTLGFVFASFPTREISDLAGTRAGMMHEMVELASISIASLNLRSKLENQSIRDGLTNLFNRHFMEVALERELHRAARRNTTLAVFMLDVDHFKTFNDTFGHEAGDAILREVADCFRHTVRKEDIICRYGGEEFVIILPEISEELALDLADLIRIAVSKIHLELKGVGLRKVTLSIGVAMYPQPARDAADLLRLADQALYAAKRNGRDQVRAATELVPA